MNQEDEDIDALEAELQYDYEIGEIFKTQVIANAVDWFTGKAHEYIELEDDEDEDDGEFEYSEDGDDSEECQEESDEEVESRPMEHKKNF